MLTTLSAVSAGPARAGNEVSVVRDRERVEHGVQLTSQHPRGSWSYIAKASHLRHFLPGLDVLALRLSKVVPHTLVGGRVKHFRHLFD